MALKGTIMWDTRPTQANLYGYEGGGWGPACLKVLKAHQAPPRLCSTFAFDTFALIVHTVTALVLLHPARLARRARQKESFIHLRLFQSCSCNQNVRFRHILHWSRRRRRGRRRRFTTTVQPAKAYEDESVIMSRPHSQWPKS